MQTTELSLNDARSVLIKTAESIGYPEALAIQLADSAIWLECCGAGGMNIVVLYMMQTKSMDFDARKPAQDPEHGLSSVCPIMGANVIVNSLKEEVPEGVIELRGPAAPALMMPLVIEYGAARGRGVRLHAYDTEMRFSPFGFEFETASKGTFPRVDAALKSVSGIEFIEPFKMTAPEARTSLEIPASRYSGGETLDL